MPGDETIHDRLLENLELQMDHEEGGVESEPILDGSCSAEAVEPFRAEEASIHRSQMNIASRDCEVQSIVFPHSDHEDDVEEPAITSDSFGTTDLSPSMFSTGMGMIARYGQGAAKAGRRLINDATLERGLFCCMDT
jgi:hypothetical protein